MKRLITLILAIALCVPLYIPAQAEFQYDLSEYSLLLNIMGPIRLFSQFDRHC